MIETHPTPRRYANVDTEVQTLRTWFGSREITDVVVGFSGGVDSAVTAALLACAGLKVHLVVAEVQGQRYASPFGGHEGAERFGRLFDIAPPLLLRFDHLFWGEGERQAAMNEAALPILRNAVFYGEAAALRAEGCHAVVAGTANFSEAGFLGFWGKASDGAQDVYPISHLDKMDVYFLASAMEVPSEIIDAAPSGDLQFTQTDDRTMIGASYEQIETVTWAAQHGTWADIMQSLRAVDDYAKFRDNILRNAFKYYLPFPGFHVSPRLEQFRQRHYDTLLRAVREHEHV